MTTTSRSADLTSGPMLQKIILFSVPLAASSILQLLFNAADVVVVGRFAGSTALAAVGSNGSLINLLVNLFVGLSLGANVVAARCFGARDEKGVQDTVHTAVALGLVSGVLLAVVGFCAARGLLELMSCPEDVIGLSTLYLKIYFIGMPMTMLYNFSSALLRAVGDTKRPLYCLAAAGVINVVLNLVFVIGFSMSVAGVALATIISQTVSALLVTGMLVREKGALRLDLRRLAFHAGTLKQILLIGLPAGLQSTVFSLSNVVIQSSINSFGTDTIAAWTAYGKVDSIFWMIMGAYGVSITTFAGQNFGAGKYDRIKKSVRICLGLAAVTSLFLSFIVLNFGGTILLLFTRDTNVINICIGMMRVVSPAYITYICIEILSGTCRGCGDSFFPMLLTCFGVCVLRILWITIAVPLRHEVATVAFSYPLTWTITSILFILYYKRGKWMQKDTLRNAPQGQGKDA